MSSIITEYSIDISGGGTIVYPLPYRSQILGFRQDGSSATNIILGAVHNQENASPIENRKFRFLVGGSTFDEYIRFVVHLATGEIVDPVTSVSTTYYLFEVLV